MEVCSKLSNGFVTAFFLFAFTLILALPLGLLMSFCTMGNGGVALHRFAEDPLGAGLDPSVDPILDLFA